jgi:hypothetical protein
MPIAIKELTTQVFQDTTSSLAARLDRLEKALGLTGDPAAGGGDLELQVAGALTIHAKEIRLIARDLATIQTGASKIEILPGKMVLFTPGPFEASAATVKYSCGSFAIDAAMTNCAGVLRANTMITQTIVAQTYTPGAGNVW